MFDLRMERKFVINTDMFVSFVWKEKSVRNTDVFVCLFSFVWKEKSVRNTDMFVCFLGMERNVCKEYKHV